MRKKVLITGASGFVGYHLIETALQRGLVVRAAVRNSSDIRHLAHYNIEYVELDYSSAESMQKHLETEQYSYIIHAAGITKAKNALQYNKINAEYTKNLSLAATRAKINLEKFVFVSSLAALGPLTDLQAEINDDTAGNPVTAYGVSKLLAEKYLKEIKGLPLITIRPTAVYGPRERDLFILFKTINKGLEPHIGSFKQHLSFVYVKDLAQVTINALFTAITCKSYNVTDGNVYDRYAFAGFIKNTLNKRTFKFHLPVGVVAAMASFMDVIYKNSKNTPTLNKEKMAELTAVNWACNIEQIKCDLGYQPKFDLERGLEATVKWYKENGWL